MFNSGQAAGFSTFHQQNAALKDHLFQVVKRSYPICSEPPRFIDCRCAYHVMRSLDLQQP